MPPGMGNFPLRDFFRVTDALSAGNVKNEEVFFGFVC